MVYDAVKKLKATIISKINTWFQVGAIISYVINFRFKNPILLVAVILTIISFLQYALKAFEKEEK
jgi:phosphatidylglycerophosphate synthase